MSRSTHRRRLFLSGLIGLCLVPAASPAPGGGGSRGSRVADPPAGQSFDIAIPPPAFGATPEGFATISFPGYGDAARGGEPSRPIRVFRVEIPEGFVPRLEILEDVSRVYRGIDLAPAPRALRRSPGIEPEPPGPPARRPDRKAYARAAWIPSAPVEVGSVGWVRHRRYAQLLVFPVQYHAVRREARIHSRIRVRITLEASAETRFGRRTLGEEGFQPVYREAFGKAARVGADSGETEMSPSTSAFTLASTSSASSFPAYRIRVSRDGIYRLTYEYLNDPARAAALIALNPDPAAFKLTCQGQEIPVRVMNGGDPARFEPGEFLEFYGEHLAGNFLDPDDFEQGDFTDVNVYRLSVETGARLRIPEIDGSPLSGFPVPASFSHTEVDEDSDIYLGQLPFDGAGHWYDSPFIREGANGTPSETAFPVTLNGTGTSGTARVEVRMLGMDYLDNLHRTSLEVNGVAVGSTEDWDGFGFHVQSADFAATVLDEGTNTVNVIADPSRSPAGIEAILLDRIEITYPRAFAAVGTALRFAGANVDTRYQVSAIGSDPTVYEITGNLPGATLRAPVRITGGTLAGDVLAFDSPQDGVLAPGAVRTFALASGLPGTGGYLLPDAVETDIPSDLRNPANGADWILIAHRDLLDLSPGSDLDGVLALRQSRGLRTIVVDVQDVFDEFSFGITDPQAIRDFLGYAFANWIPPAPLYAVLLGDAIYDTKNHYGAPETRDFVPTYMRDQSDSAILGYYADDTYFAAVAGADPIPDLLLGRIPAHDLTEAEGYWRKVLDYEVAGTGAAWESRAVFVADEGEPLFEIVQDNQIDRHFSGTPHTAQRIYYQDIIDANGGVKTSVTADLATGQIQAAIDSGAALMNFVGHGGFQQWSQFPDIYRSLSNRVRPGDTPVADDIDPLGNAPRFPFMINTNCITGGFHITGPPDQPQTQDRAYSFAEDFLVTPGKGLIGALAPSHLTFSFVLDLVNNGLFEAIYGPGKERDLGNLALVLRLAFESLGMTHDLRSYAFLGDPAVRLRVPAPAPPGGVTATGGNQRVDLAWTASPGAAAYNVYRSGGSPSGPYVRVNASPVTATAFADTAVVNAATYHYALTSADAGGFEGRFSHFNLDCAGAGPDCLRAVPLNPDPPGVPTGLTAEDVGSGGTVFLAWNPNLEPDLDFYTLHYGTVSGVYDQQKTLGPGATSLSVPGLTDGQAYFFSLTVTNTSDRTSGFSAEAAAVPRRLLGIAPPRAVRGLQVTVSGADLLLTWNPVTADIRGDAAAIASYTVYASTAGPDFPLAGNELATVPGTETAFLHAGSAADPANYFYLVAARDPNGLLSAAGHEIPAGILNLTVETVPGGLRLDWTPITTDLFGGPTRITHYALYSDTAPFGRDQVGPGLLELDGILAPPILLPLPAGERYYSLLAVDNRGTMSPF